MVIKELGADVMPVVAYNIFENASPQLRTERQFQLMVEAGVNIIYAYDGESAELNSWIKKYNVKYLLRRPIFEEYLKLDGVAFPAFNDMTEDMIAKLDSRFVNELKKYALDSACVGIAFRDEPGIEMFKAIAHAKSVASKVIPNKLFYINMFPYYISSEQYENSNYFPNKKSTIKELETNKRNIYRYEYFINRFIDEVKPALLSFDAYTFQTLANVKTGIHEAFYEIPQFYHSIEKSKGIPHWNFLQCGGKWEGALTLRAPSFSEVQLNFSIPLLYGAKGVEIFPYHFPTCWMDDENAYGGMMGRDGEPTELYSYYLIAMRQLKAIQSALMNSTLNAIMCVGEYSQLLPPQSELDGKLWQEMIFKGELPEFANICVEHIDGIKNVQSTSQILIGEFEYGDKKALFCVNNSTTTALNANIEFDNKKELTIIRNAITEKTIAENLEISALSAGENLLIIM